MTSRNLVAVGMGFVLGATAVRGGEPTAAQRAFFENKIRPVLVEHCYPCHSAEAKKQKGGLRLDHRDALVKGGASGPALVRGKPDESLLIKAVRFASDDLKMPPKGKLPAAAIADLETWVAKGAPDPRVSATPTKAPTTWEEMLKARRDWWSLQPVRRVETPTLQDANWSAHPLDRFVMAHWKKAGLSPSALAEPRTLIRRLTLVLTGLPPTPAEIEAFVQAWEAPNKRQQAIEDCVHRLLASHHYGERWARHWMDVVRFTETHGNEWNYDVHHAWRYRDYLIRAFNEDVPYDRLVREHIAGDLAPPRWNAQERFNEAPIGTAFYRFGEVNHDDCIGLRTLGYDILDNQIDTMTKAFQATTVACARCHDHKIDAVSMKDYYALLGILRSSRPATHTLDAPDVNAESIERLARLKSATRRVLADHWLKEVEALDAARLDGLKVEATSLENPLHLWRSTRQASDVAKAWREAARLFGDETGRRATAESQDYVTWADFRRGDFAGWSGAGQGLHYGRAAPGEFIVAAGGTKVVSRILPSGRFTHMFSEKLNGALRSPILATTKKRISFQVMGQKQAAVRIVSNSCQLNYRNFKALKSGQWHWITFDIPEEAVALRCYAELMTKFDNPKYPDQLGQLGGDDTNQRVPWDKAAADPHSHFGVTRVVLHDVAQPPPDDLSWLQSLYSGAAPADREAVVARYRDRIRHAARGWADGTATDDDARWLDWLVQNGVLTNDTTLSPILAKLTQDYHAVESRLVLPRIVPGLADVDGGIDQPVFVRGDCKKPSDYVARRYLEVLSPPAHVFLPRGSGRLALADAVADPKNPFTARVMVNRVWHHVFGHGLVRTTDDFGRMGDLPSHPELLDWLATRFVEDGWSVKKLIRLLVTSQTFQLTSRAESKAAEVDPLNRLLHHYQARRLEAEAIRDSILAVSGRLDRALFGLSILPYREGTNEDRRLFPGPLDGQGRRSIYIKVNLMEGARFLSAFDLPGGKVTQGRRDVTNVPAQALALLNDPFVVQQAEEWAKKLVQRPRESSAARIDFMFQSALGRSPAKVELERFERFVEQVTQVRHGSATDVSHSVAVWQDVAHALFNVQEFLYIP